MSASPGLFRNAYSSVQRRYARMLWILEPVTPAAYLPLLTSRRLLPRGWGKYDLSFELTEPEAYRRDVPKAQVHVLDAGHFALDTAADEIADLVRRFMSNKQ
jgi:pimeloyl-ACP methyl ester carboxylesterase